MLQRPWPLACETAAGEGSGTRPVELWQLVWREGFAPLLSTTELAALRVALIEDDPQLIQGGTTMPPPLHSTVDCPVEAACALGYCLWQGKGLTTVGEVEEAFARLCYEADLRLGEPTVCRWFLNWFDDTPRETVRLKLLEEVERVLAERNDRADAQTLAAA